MRCDAVQMRCDAVQMRCVGKESSGGNEFAPVETDLANRRRAMRREVRLKREERADVSYPFCVLKVQGSPIE